MKRLLITLVLAGALGTTAVALAAGHGPITEKVLGAASIGQPYTFQVKQPADVVVAKATVPPGASFGWHSHRAAVVAIVKSGTLSLYDSADPDLYGASLPGRTGFHRAARPRPPRPQRGAQGGRSARHVSRAQARRQPRRAGPQARELPVLITARRARVCLCILLCVSSAHARERTPVRRRLAGERGLASQRSGGRTCSKGRRTARRFASAAGSWPPLRRRSSRPRSRPCSCAPGSHRREARRPPRPVLVVQRGEAARGQRQGGGRARGGRPAEEALRLRLRRVQLPREQAAREGDREPVLHRERQDVRRARPGAVGHPFPTGGEEGRPDATSTSSRPTRSDPRRPRCASRSRRRSSTPSTPTTRSCPRSARPGFDCNPVRGIIRFHARAYADSAGGDFFSVGGVAYIEGHEGRWTIEAATSADSRRPLWDDGNFSIDDDVDDLGTRSHAVAELRAQGDD